MHTYTFAVTRALQTCCNPLHPLGLIKWYSTPSPNLSPYIFLGLDPSPVTRALQTCCNPLHPLTEKIRLNMFGSPDLSVFPG